MSRRNTELARRGYEALSAGDLESVLALIHPEVRVEIYTGRPDLPETQTLHGHAGFLDNLAQLTEVFDEIEVHPEDFIEVGDDLIVVINVSGRGKASGVRVENRVVHLWTMRDGLVTRFRVYPDKETAMAAADT
jgi:ketosteroid isomerase-like protein